MKGWWEAERGQPPSLRPHHSSPTRLLDSGASSSAGQGSAAQKQDSSFMLMGPLQEWWREGTPQERRRWGGGCYSATKPARPCAVIYGTTLRKLGVACAAVCREEGAFEGSDGADT